MPKKELANLQAAQIIAARKAEFQTAIAIAIALLPKTAARIIRKCV